MSQELPLAAEFPTATHEAWRKLVDGVLKGRPFEKLTSRTYDGIAIEPLYARAGNDAPVIGRPAGAPWQIMTRIDHPDAAAANAQALRDLENGATGLSIPFAGAVGAYGFGLPATAEAVAKVLDGVFLDAGVAIEFDIPATSLAAASAIADHVRQRGIAPKDVNLRFGIDPFAADAAAGTAPEAASFAPLVRDLAAAGFSGPFVAADGRVVHAAGGSEGQELAFALAAATATLRALEAAGSPLEAARAAIFFRLAADADEFLTIAKLRSLRRLWARVEEACGLAPKPAHLSVETAWRMLTRRDPNVNMLRATMATFSAAVGGADAITVLPLTSALGLPDPWARRVARNTQLILAEESNLAKVADPAAGAGAFAALTRELCAAAWKEFQAIEAAGGLAAALAHGDFQKKVETTRHARDKAIALRREPLTGTSEFPLLGEAAPDVLLPAAPVAHPPHTLPRLAPHRLAEPFEALRDASDRIAAETGARPKVFLANLGRLADFLPRATFAKNFFEVGGIEAVGNEGFARADGATDLAALAEAFKASRADLACFCATDEAYARESASATTALRAAGAGAVYLAGRPGDQEATLNEAGVAGYVFAGCDALQTLRAVHAKIA